jgi:pimeloyl-ACP methyl ester carboxylesterase
VLIERPVVFASNGHQLAGVLHLPDQKDPPEIAVLFVHSGARGRLGSTFQYPLAARALAARGIASLRFDPTGMGDSEGEIADMKVLDFFGTIQVGRFVADTLAAIDELDRLVKPKKLVLWGLCGGGITALLAAPRASRTIDGLVLLSTPVLLDSAQQSPLERISAEHATSYLWSVYAKKLLSPKAWRRLFSAQSDMKTLRTYGTAAVTGLVKKARKKLLARLRPKPPADAPRPPGNPRANPHFFEALDAMVKRRARLLMLYGETDALRYDFWTEVHDPILERDAAYRAQLEVHLVPRCNHLFTLREWQDEALAHATRWLATI